MSDEIAGFAAPEFIPHFPVATQPRRRAWLHGVLLLATFVTACMSGSWWWEDTSNVTGTWAELLSPSRLAHGIPYALLLILILGAHEMGHYLACRYYRVPATLPFFIPGPPLLIGTFGAVIRIRGPIPSRRALFDIAAAGPIAGFIVALPVLIVGAARLVEVPPTPDLHGMFIGDPLVSIAAIRFFHGSDASLQLNSIYGAAWVGMLVTSMNLFPVGQLDGGHAVFAISPRAHAVISWATIAGFAVWVIGQSVWTGMPSPYSLWLGILLILRGRHPRLLDEGEPLGWGRRAVAAFLLAILVLTFMGAPMGIN